MEMVWSNKGYNNSEQRKLAVALRWRDGLLLEARLPAGINPRFI
jgi:hypothetical protein